MLSFLYKKRKNAFASWIYDLKLLSFFIKKVRVVKVLTETRKDKRYSDYQNKGIFMRFAKLFGAATLLASMIASAQAGTIVTVKVKNFTTGPAAYTFEYFSGSR